MSRKHISQVCNRYIITNKIFGKPCPKNGHCPVIKNRFLNSYCKILSAEPCIITKKKQFDISLDLLTRNHQGKRNVED